jgi:hypothetical protein
VSDERERRLRLVESVDRLERLVEGNSRPDGFRDCPRVAGRVCDCPPETVPVCWPEDERTCAPGPALAADESTIAVEAQAAVYGPREGDYGHPREDFTRTAIIWTGLLQHKLADGAFIDADDIARCMIGVKLSRDVHSPKRDNRVDGVGYFITLDRLETGQ